jgi:4-hydroxybenzoate polyprenyltransferase
MKSESCEQKNIVFVFLTEFIRVRGVITWSLISFLGFILGMSSLELSNYTIPLLTFVVSTFCILSFTFAINNYFDTDSDRENPRRKHINAIASGKISKKNGILLIIIFVLISLIQFYISLKFSYFVFCF